MLMNLLLNWNTNLVAEKEIMLFPIFGRGRVVPPATGEEIQPEAIREVAEFLTGPCSCEVKEMNPGYDLLLSANWNSLGDYQCRADVGVPPLTGLSQFAAGATNDPKATPGQPTASLAAASTAPLARGHLVRNLAMVLGIGMVFLAAATLVLKARAGRGPDDMNLYRLVFREILHRKLSFSLGVVSAAAAVACLVAELAILQKHDARTEQVITAKEAETRQEMAKLEDDYRKLTLKMGFNVLILPKGQDLSDLYADDFASKYMPEEYATRLAKSRVATINHVLPSLQQKVKWPECERTVLLMGVRGEVYIQSKQQKPLLEPVAPGTMILGHELARNLALKAGDKTKLMGREFTVTKVNAERGNKDDITVWISLAEAQEMLGKPGLINGILALDCTCDTVDRLGRIRPEIARILPDTQLIEYASQALARAEARQRAADRGPSQHRA